MSKTPVILPLLSDTMTTGRLARWLKNPGDAVQVGDVLAEVESDKAIMDVEAFKAGYLAGPLAPVDTDVPVKSTIAWIVDDPVEMDASKTGRAVSSSDASLAAVATPSSGAPVAGSPEPRPVLASAEGVSSALAAPVSPPQPPDSKQPAPEDGRASSANPLASGAAAPISTAAEAVSAKPMSGASAVVAAAFAGRTVLGLGPDRPQGAGVPRGQNPVNDPAHNLAMAPGIHPAHFDLGPVDRIERPTPLKAAMAENVAQSLQIPTFRVAIDVDLKPLSEAAHAAGHSFTLVLAKACALSLQEHPDFNACWTAGGVARRKRVDMAIAMDTPDGLITPVLRHAARSLVDLAVDWQHLKEKVRTRRLAPTDYRGGTFYLSNLGPFPEIVQFDAIVPSGAAAILAVAAPARNGLTRLTLSCDHRVVAGADAARMMSTLKAHLLRPDWLQS